MATKHPTYPLWRVWARTARFPGSVQILVSAPTRADAIDALSDGVTVTRCVREVRS
jgi:hypothetical protein